MEYRYKGQFLFDLAGHKKFNRIFYEANTSRCVFTILYCVFALWMVHQFTIASMVRYFLIFALALLIFTIASNPKKGNIYYKRMLQANMLLLATMPASWCFMSTVEYILIPM